MGEIKVVICRKCNCGYDEKYGVCPNCGIPYQQYTENIAAMPNKSKSGLIAVISISAVVLIGIFIALIMIFSHPNTQSQLNEQISLGEKYLNEENYEEAIVAFKKAIEIEPNTPELYIKLADAYIAKGDTANAISILQEGYEKTQSEKIKTKLDGLTNVKDEVIIEESSEISEELSTVSEAEQEKTIQPIYFDAIQKYNGEVYYMPVLGVTLSKSNAGPNHSTSFRCDFSALGYKMLPLSEEDASGECFVIYNNNIYYTDDNKLKCCDFNGNNVVTISDITTRKYYYDEYGDSKTFERVEAKLENGKIIFGVEEGTNIIYKSYDIKTGDISTLSEEPKMQTVNKLPSYIGEITTFDGGEYYIQRLDSIKQSDNYPINLLLMRKDLITGKVIEVGCGFTAQSR